MELELTMSMFATQADYWKARAELAETTVHEIAKALRCRIDNEVMLERVERQRDALNELARYFTSGNRIPVERAVICAEDFWRITGLTPN